MMKEIEYIDDWRKLKNAEIIDVRSPSEFNNDHIPGSINIPILNDQQRHDVGKTYKEVNPFKAKIMGASIISKNISKFLDNEFFSRKGSWQALIYCWRGGQRSRSLALVLNEIGWRISILKGGYKNYRKLVLDELNDLSKYQFKILQGQTGSAKTKILNCLNNMNAQVIDLENLACHRGSLLGSEINKKQHSQRYFESLLHNAIDKFDCTKPIFIESESSKIGKLHLPKKLWTKLNESDRLLLNVPIDERIKFLLKEYKHLTKDCKLIQPFISGMKGKIANEKLSNWRILIQRKEWENFVKEILENHYDPKYSFSAMKHNNKIKHKIDLIKLNKLSIENASKKILEYFN